MCPLEEKNLDILCLTGLNEEYISFYGTEFNIS